MLMENYHFLREKNTMKVWKMRVVCGDRRAFVS